MAVIDKGMKLIDEFNVNDKMKLRLRVGEYNGIERIDIRLWVEGTKGLGPTRRGINFNVEWLPRFIEMTEKLKNI